MKQCGRYCRYVLMFFRVPTSVSEHVQVMRTYRRSVSYLMEMATLSLADIIDCSAVEALRRAWLHFEALCG